MRKVTPLSVVTRFDEEALELFHYLDRVAKALPPGSLRDHNHLARTAFVALYASFEGFLSNLFLAYINRDSSVFQADLRSRLTQSVSQRFGAPVASRVLLPLPKHLPLAAVPPLVDPTARNITFRTASDLGTFATRWLAKPHASRILALKPDDLGLIDAARAVRNQIAHQSVASHQEMNATLGALSDPILRRGTRRIDNVGVYLRAFVAGSARITHFGIRLRDIATRC